MEEVLGEPRNLTVRSFGGRFTGIFFILFSFLIFVFRGALIRSLKEETRLTRVRMLHMQQNLNNGETIAMNILGKLRNGKCLAGQLGDHLKTAKFTRLIVVSLLQVERANLPCEEEKLRSGEVEQLAQLRNLVGTL